MYLTHMPSKKLCFVGREWFCAQASVKVGVSELHGGVGTTKQNENKEDGYSREDCGVVDRREIDGKKMERKKRLGKQMTRMKRTICKETSIGKGISQALAGSGEGFRRQDMRRELKGGRRNPFVQ